MNPNYTEFKFPQIKAHPWTKVSFSELDNEGVWDERKTAEFRLILTSVVGDFPTKNWDPVRKSDTHYILM